MRIRFSCSILLFLWLASVLNAGEPRVVIVFGDSITAGNMLPAAQKAQAWVNRVKNEAGEAWEVINEGKGGRPTDSVKEFASMLQRHPHADLLVIALGTNDSRDISEQCVPKTVANLRAMISEAREHFGGKVAILLVGPPNIRKDALGPTRPIADQRESQLRALGAAFEALAGEEHCAFANLFGAVPPASLGSDGVHPDAAGNEAIARTLLPSLRALLPP